VKKNVNITDSNYSRYRVNGDIEVLQRSFTSRSFKPHFHDSYALILVESGVADYGHRNKENVVTDNKLLVLNPYEVHTGRSLGEGVWNFRSMYIPKDLIKTSYNLLEDRHPTFVNQLIQHREFLARYQVLHDKMMSHDITMEEETELNELLQMLAELSGIELSRAPDSGYAAISERMRDYIHEYYAENIQLDDLMRISNYSKFHLIKVFRDRFGLAPHQYLNNLRIEKAKGLLIGGMSATDVAFAVGYFDQSHFIRHFKKVVGVTPLAYLS